MSPKAPPQAAPNDLQIRAANQDDYDDLKAVWRDAFGPQIFGGEDVYDEFFSWAFRSNPDCSTEEVCQWVGEIDGDVISVWATTPVELLINGVGHKACWLQNTAVATRGQRKGIGKRMFRFILANYPMTLGVGVVTSSRALYEAEGVHFVPADTFAALHLSALAPLRRLAGSVYRRRFLDAGQLVRSLLLRLAAARRKPAEVEIAAVSRFDERIDEFFAKVEPAIPVMTRRNAEKLNWIIANPRLRTVSFVASRRDAICGYVIARQDGFILDFLVHPDDGEAFRALTIHVKQWAKANSLSEISGIIPGLPALRKMYARAGFIPLGGRGFGLFYAFPDISRTCAVLSDPQNWYFSLADSDLYSFRLQG